MASASSPRPWTSQASGRSVGSTRIETLPTSSRSIRSLTRRAVTLVPLTRPTSGEAGVGKSSLLAYVSDRADGWRVARAVGVDSEMELAYGSLHQLCVTML